MGDLLFTTNNEVLLRNHVQLDALCCLQKKAPKKVVTEEDIITANKLGFGNEVGSVTNKTTAQASLRASFEKDSEEYKILTYRIQCGQNYNQNAVDKCKGVISKKMPSYWYSKRGIQFNDDDSPEDRKMKELYWRICSDKPPYFFSYLYPRDKKKYDDYEKNAKTNAGIMYGKTLEELKKSDYLNDDEIAFLKNYYKNLPLDRSPSVMNKICWAIEDVFDDMKFIPNEQFDYSILKSGIAYDIETYKSILQLYDEYKKQTAVANKVDAKKSINSDEESTGRDQIMSLFAENCAKICPDEEILCEILVDAGYCGKINKNLVWYVSGNIIIKNLLKRNNNLISYPILDKNGDIKCCGGQFSMRTLEVRW